MSLDLNPQAETILRQEAEREGISVDDLIVRTFSTHPPKRSPATRFSKAAAPANGEHLARPQETTEATKQKRPSALGMYAFVAGGSEEFAREKQAEIEREDRAR